MSLPKLSTKLQNSRKCQKSLNYSLQRSWTWKFRTKCHYIKKRYDTWLSESSKCFLRLLFGNDILEYVSKAAAGWLVILHRLNSCSYVGVNVAELDLSFVKLWIQDYIASSGQKNKVIGVNKLAKARKTRKSPGTLSLKKFGSKIFVSMFSLNWIILRFFSYGPTDGWTNRRTDGWT